MLRAKRQNDTHDGKPAILQKLEQRLLLSADPLSVAIDSAPQDEALDSELAIAHVLKDLADSDVQGVSAYTLESPALEFVSEQRVELIIVDESVAGFADVVTNISSNSETQYITLIINSDTNGIQQITEAMQTFSQLNALHIVAHNTDAGVLLGNTYLNTQTLDTHSSELSAWDNHLNNSADILLYACDVASTVQGQEFLQSLANITGTDVAASVDTTGHQTLGGNWALEYQQGAIETAVFADQQLRQTWQIALGTFTDNFDTASYNNSDGSEDWSANAWVEFDNGGGTGPTDGAIRFVQHNGATALQVGGGDEIHNSLGRWIAFPTGASDATLSFNMAKIGFSAPEDRVFLQFLNPASNWNTIASFSGADSNVTPYNFDISNGFVGSHFAFRFVTDVGMEETAAIILHDVEVAFDTPNTLQASNLNQQHPVFEDSGTASLQAIEIQPMVTSGLITALVVPDDPEAGFFKSTIGTTDTVTGGWQYTGTRDAVNAALAQLSFTLADNYDQDFSADVTLTMQGLPSLRGEIDFELTAINDAPSLNVAPQSSTYSEGQAAVQLFLDANFDPFEDGQQLKTLVLDLHGMQDGENEFIWVDGHAIAIAQASNIAADGFRYSVSYDSLRDIHELRLHFDSGTTIDASDFIASIEYQHNGIGAGISAGLREVIITSIIDNGGSAHGGIDTNLLNEKATIAVDGISAPIANDIEHRATEDDTTTNIAFSLLAHDSGNIEYTIFSSIPAAMGQIQNNGNGSFSFTPGPALQSLGAGETQQLSFTYTASDRSAADRGTSDEASVKIIVEGRNDGPTITGDRDEHYTEDTSTRLSTLVASDKDSAQLTLILQLSDSNAGSISAQGITLNETTPGRWQFEGEGSEVQQLLQQLQFTPAANYNDAFVITFSVDDGEQQQSHQLAMHGEAVNDPVAGQLNILVQEQRLLIADTQHLSDADGINGFEYQWLRDGEPIAGETAARYEMANIDIGAEISVAVTLTDNDGHEEILFAPIYVPKFIGGEPTENETKEKSPQEKDEQASATNNTVTPPNTEEEQLASQQPNDSEPKPLTTNPDTNKDSSTLTIQPIERLQSPHSIQLEFALAIPVDIDPDSPRTSAATSYQTALVDTYATQQLYVNELGNSDAQQHFDNASDLFRKNSEAIDVTVGGVLGTSASLSVGYVLWLTRSGILLSTILSSLPTWQVIDPLPVLGSAPSAAHSDQESLADMVEHREDPAQSEQHDSQTSQK